MKLAKRQEIDIKQF